MEPSLKRTLGKKQENFLRKQETTMKNKKSQIWVETAIYTLIGLTLIAVISSAALPQIEKMKDREIVKQSLVQLNEINKKILYVREAPSSVRRHGIIIGKGKLEINPINDTITYVLENTRLQFGEVGQKIQEGDIISETQKYGSRYNVYLILNVSTNSDITFNQKTESKVLQAGSTQYDLIITNTGTSDDKGRYIIDISV